MSAMTLAFHDYRRMDALALAEAITLGAISRAEVLQAALARWQAVNPLVNAISWSDDDLVARALGQAQAADDAAARRRTSQRATAQVAATRAKTARGSETTDDHGAPLDGVPYLIKDLHAPVAGMPLRHGSRLFIDHRPDFDSETVSRLRRAGLVMLGRTASPEFGMNVTTEPALSGPTRNPWLLSHSAGGSSGGAAAAVAAGILPAAHATDSGGSIRIPASCCGLVGLKPTRGLLPTGPHRGDASHGLSHEHAVTRSVRDCAALLDATAGPDVGAPYFTAPPAEGFLATLGRPVRRLRIASTTRRFGGGAPLHPDCVQAVDSAARTLATLGHEVEAAAPDFDAAALSSATGVLMMAGLAATVHGREAELGRAARDDELEAVTREAVAAGDRIAGPHYASRFAVINREVRRIGTFFTRFDVLLTPTLAAPPLQLGVLDAQRLSLQAFQGAWADYTPFSGPFNATGQPAVSLPLHWNAEGLPIGVQAVGRFGDDSTLLQLAAQLEQAQPWFDRVPQVGL
jgi:Asp-tRNA(Asn)/Glu-tRNA(Gln) amidotransferase A subunit family amidase